jgi:hypothetical protein
MRPRGRTILLALLALPAAAFVRAEDPAQTRVVIRGTGENVSIERVPAAARRQAAGPAASPIIGEAARMAAKGAGDDAVISYLARHQAELPDVVESSDVRLLRKSGAGSRVVVYLEAVTAVDLGAMGEGREGSQIVVPSQQESMSLAANEYPNYPFYGGYGSSSIPLRSALRTFARFPHRPVHRPMPVPFSSHGSMMGGRRLPQ